MSKTVQASALLIQFLLTCFVLTAQPTIEWEKSLGGSSVDNGRSIQQTADGGYIVAGSSNSTDGDITTNYGGYDYWIVKLDASGNLVWQKNVGSGFSQVARSIQQTSDGGYIVAGNSVSVTTGMDYWLVKLDASGNIIWDTLLGGSESETPHSIQQTSDGGYIVAGYSFSTDGNVTGNQGGADYWVVKINSSGALVWEKSLGGSDDDYAYSIEQTTDGGYIVLGLTSSTDGDITSNHGDQDLWVVKLNATGSITWEKCYGGSNEEATVAYRFSIKQTSDGGYVMASNTESTDGDVTNNNGLSDGWVVKIDPSGGIVWDKNLGGTSFEDLKAIQQTSDGGYIVCGYTGSTDGDVTQSFGALDYWIVKLNASGDIIWEKSFGGSGQDEANSIQETADGGLIVLGVSYSTDGDVTGNHGMEDYWVVKLGNTENIGENQESIIAVYPNPSSDIIAITVTEETLNSSYRLFDQNGKLVLSGKINSTLTELDLEPFESGTYKLIIGENENGTSGRIVKL